MGRTINRLTELQVRRAGKGWHHDGGGLYLRVADRAGRWWVFRYGSGGRRYHGLGPVHTLSLSEAREQARRCRQLLLQGADPIDTGKAHRAAMRRADAKTFEDCARAYHNAHRAEWRSAQHAREWIGSLATHVFPTLGTLPVATIDTALVMRALEPIWTKVPETASRIRTRIEAVLDLAKAHGYRDGENPARWRGHLDHLLPARKKRGARVSNHLALPYAAVPDLMHALRHRNDVAARALQFIILTAGRAGEICNATWDEISLADRLWIIPADRMKADREHLVPLADAAMAALEQTPPDRRTGYVFPGTRPGRPLASAVMWRLAQELTGGATTVHGLRSSFRDWVAERTDFGRDLAERALAHQVGNDVERRYQRSTLAEKRRLLMEAWADFCTSAPTLAAAVVPIRARHG